MPGNPIPEVQMESVRSCRAPHSVRRLSVSDRPVSGCEFGVALLTYSRECCYQNAYKKLVISVDTIEQSFSVRVNGYDVEVL